MTAFSYLQLLAQEASAAADLARGEQDQASLADLARRLTTISRHAGRARRAALLELATCDGEQPLTGRVIGLGEGVS